MKKTSKPLNCYNKGEPLPKVKPTVAPTILSSSEVKSSITLLKGDCLQVMKGIPDKSVDLIICDLPYGCLTNQSGESKGYARDSHKGTSLEKKLANQSGVGCAWDIKIDLEIFWKEVKRIRRNEHSATIHFCNTKFGYELIKSNEREFRYDLVWNKERGVSFLSANKMPMKSHEMIYIFSKAGCKYNRIDIEGDFKAVGGGCKPSNVYGGAVSTNKIPTNEGKRCALSIINSINTATKGNHPTQKPIELYKFLIERYSNAGDVVLDPTFGSGNSGSACKELNRKYIGIEKDEKFFWKATNRLLTVDGETNINN
jgi:site-specific DNA-methyltransferase (adenine-specific)